LSGFRFKIAVESISPNDLREQVYRKLREHVAVGVREIWLISLEPRGTHSPRAGHTYCYPDGSR
jgi:Uma2 family endonuclease